MMLGCAREQIGPRDAPERIPLCHIRQPLVGRSHE